MLEFLRRLLDGSGFPPRWECGTGWTSALGWLHILSDLAIFAAYTAIPCILASFVIRRKDVYFPKIFWLFCGFIFSCGAVHLVEAAIFWQPWYRLSGFVKLVTAATSWMTVLALIPVLPRALALPGLRTANDALRNEVERRRRSEDLFRRLIEAAPSGILMVNEQGRIVLANAKAHRQFGYDDQELAGNSIESLVPERIRHVHCRYREAFLESPAARPMGEGRDLYGVRKDGCEFPVEIGLTPTSIEDERLVLVNVVDLTFRKRVEQERRAKTDEMEQLLFTVSHDLKSPLITVEGFTGIMQQHIEAGELDKIDDDIRRIKRATKTMARLIHDILELSRVNSQNMNPTQINVNEVLDEVRAAVDGPLQAAEARLDIAAQLGAISADRRQFVHLMLNLVGNAIKYGCPKPGGAIKIGRIDRGQEALFFVLDHGPGVADADRESVFRLFQRRSDEHDGTGLGLAIVRKIMSLHHGRAWVDATPGGGATFWISFPSEPLIGDFA